MQFLARWWMLLVAAALGVGLLVFIAWLYHIRDNGSPSRPTAQTGERVLVITVPGTYGNQGFWPTVVADKATFASELLSALPTGSEVYPFLWASSVFHEKRVEAAKNLADLIDRRAEGFDRVCLVGHSHGGNVALMATALAKRRIDAVVCLSTPHVYVRTVGAGGENRLLPIYCSPQTLHNAGQIVTISPNTDHVPDTWSNETLTGLTENVALGLTAEWQEAFSHPRLPNDRFLFRLFENGNIVALKGLDIAAGKDSDKAVLNCSVRSFVKGIVKPHASIHSRRMGRIVGDLIAGGIAPKQVDYLRRLVQPAGEDDGEPIPLAEHSQAVAQMKDAYDHAGWWLENVAITLDPMAVKAAREDAVDPYVRVTASDGTVLLKTKSQRKTATAKWSPDCFFPDGGPINVAVWDANLVAKDTCLGTRQLSLDKSAPPAHWPADAKSQIYWSGDFGWLSVHY